MRRWARRTGWRDGYSPSLVPEPRSAHAVGRRPSASHVRVWRGWIQSTRRLGGEPQPADRWATTADSVRGADNQSTVGCRVPCARRSCRSAGGRGSTGLRVNGTPPSAGADAAGNARAHSSAFSRHMRGRRYLSSTRPSGGASSSKRKPTRANQSSYPLSEFNSKLPTLVFILPSYLLSRKSVRNPKARSRVPIRNVPMPIALLARVTHHSAMACTSGRAQWPSQASSCRARQIIRLVTDLWSEMRLRIGTAAHIRPSRRLPTERSALAADRERSTLLRALCKR